MVSLSLVPYFDSLSNIESSGGIGYSGSTNCVGSTCQKVNDYYYQVCIPVILIIQWHE